MNCYLGCVFDGWWMMFDEWCLMNDVWWMMFDEWCLMNDVRWMMLNADCDWMLAYVGWLS